MSKPTVSFYYNVPSDINYTTPNSFDPNYYWALSSTQINIVTYTVQPCVFNDSGAKIISYYYTPTLSSSSAPALVHQSEQAVVSALGSLQTAGQQLAGAISAQETANNSAVFANTGNATVGSSADTAAISTADSAEQKWQTVFSTLSGVNSALARAISELSASQTAVNALTISTTVSAAENAAAQQEATYNQLWSGLDASQIPTGKFGNVQTGQEYASAWIHYKPPMPCATKRRRPWA